MTLREICEKAKNASYEAALLSGEEKNSLLRAVAGGLMSAEAEILAANGEDMRAAERDGKPSHFLDRLKLTEKRIDDIAAGIGEVTALPDPVGVVLSEYRTEKGLDIRKVTVPLGTVGIIYEARPNVTADTAALCLKSGNAVVLRGSKDALNSNLAIVKAIRRAIEKAGVSPECVQIIPDVSRESAVEFMRMNGLIDVLLPRGSASLIQAVVENATVPVIETGTGNCHVYIEKTADVEKAKRILINAKTSRVSVCNSCESLLYDKALERQMPEILGALKDKGVEIRACDFTRRIFPDALPATEEDYFTEFLGLTISAKAVSGVSEAVAHINKYGTKHSEAILTNDKAAAELFQSRVDAAAVFVNASTRFTDGFEFGFGAELGISTQKLHARGPIGLRELTSYKYLVTADWLSRE